MIEVGAEVSVTEYPSSRIGCEKSMKQGAERAALFGCPGVGWNSLGVQTAFIGDADAVGVVAVGVCTHEVNGAHGVDYAVFPYVEMVTARGEASGTVFSLKGCRGEVGVAT